MKFLSSKEKEELFKSKQLLLPFLLDLNSKQPYKFEGLNSQTSSEVHPKQSGVGLMMQATYDWVSDLEMLIVKYSHFGICHDVASFSLLDNWALYLHLCRLDER